MRTQMTSCSPVLLSTVILGYANKGHKLYLPNTNWLKKLIIIWKKTSIWKRPAAYNNWQERSDKESSSNDSFLPLSIYCTVCMVCVYTLFSFLCIFSFTPQLQNRSKYLNLSSRTAIDLVCMGHCHINCITQWAMGPPIKGVHKHSNCHPYKHTNPSGPSGRLKTKIYKEAWYYKQLTSTIRKPIQTKP